MVEVAFSVSDICTWISGRLVNGDSASGRFDSVRVCRPAALVGSGPTDVSFFFSKVYQNEVPGARPGILIVGDEFVEALKASGLPIWSHSAVVACARPYEAMAIVSEHFAPVLLHSVLGLTDENLEAVELDPAAVVHSSVQIGLGSRVASGVVIEEGAVIGRRCILYPGVYLGHGVVLGDHCVLFPHVVVYEGTRIGHRVRVHANTTLGSDGFGYAPVLGSLADEKPQVLNHRKIHHFGGVRIGDDVEIGANSCVDRGTLADTVIDSKAKLDNQVHVGHNAYVQEGAVLCGGVALAGNARVGKFAYVGGLTGVINHVYIGDGAQVGALTLVSKDVPAGGNAVGNPQREHREFFRVQAWLSKNALVRRK